VPLLVALWLSGHRGDIIGINPKIGITGLPRSGKSAVLEKVINMIIEERKNGNSGTRSGFSADKMIGGIKTEPIIENGERVGYACVNIQTGEKGFKIEDFGIRH
jgi:nucleoside-triphosphatase THEP1